MSVLLIAGSRTVLPPPEIIEAQSDDLLFVLGEVTELVSGGAGGADKAGEVWAARRGGIEVTVIRPDYETYGGYFAPKMRNREMARYLASKVSPLALILWDGLSGGAADMTTRLAARDIPTRIVHVDPRQYPSGTPPPADWGTREWMAAQRGRRSTLPARRR